MNLDDTKKRVQKYLNSNKRYPLIVDVQTREDLANIAEYFKVGSNKFPAIEEFCNQDEAIKLDELYASVSSNSGNTFITGLSGFLMLFGENVAKQALKTLITTSISGHVVIITYQCEKYLRFTDPRISESGRLVIVDGNPDNICNINFISPVLSDIFTDSYSGIQNIGTAIDSCFNRDAYIAIIKIYVGIRSNNISIKLDGNYYNAEETAESYIYSVELKNYSKKGKFSIDILDGGSVLASGQQFEIEKKGMSQNNMFDF